MKLLSKATLGLGGFCAVSALFGTVVFADTTNPTTSTTASPALQADRATMKQLHAENKQLNQQIKADVQAWKVANPNPFKQLTADQQSQVKTLRADIKSEQTTVKPLREQFKSLHAQLKTAKQNKDTSAVATLKGQIQPLLTTIKTDVAKIKADRQQLEAILPTGSMKTFNTKHSAFMAPLKSDLATLKQDRQQLRTDGQTLKTDRQNHNTAALDTDIQKINTDLNQMIATKQQLLKDLSAEVPTSTSSSN